MLRLLTNVNDKNSCFFSKLPEAWLAIAVTFLCGNHMKEIG